MLNRYQNTIRQQLTTLDKEKQEYYLEQEVDFWNIMYYDALDKLRESIIKIEVVRELQLELGFKIE